jgi:hypothetical protein
MTAGILASVVLITFAGCETGHASAAPKSQSALRVSFKLDPLLSGPTYGGERWVSQPTYMSAVQPGREGNVEAKAEVMEPSGRMAPIKPEWIPADPGMITVVSVGDARLGHVKMTVRHSGESKVKVVWQSASKELLVKARSVNNEAMHVVIEQ